MFKKIKHIGGNKYITKFINEEDVKIVKICLRG